MKCPKCNTEMHTVTVLGLKTPFKHYQKCPECNYKTEAK